MYIRNFWCRKCHKFTAAEIISFQFAGMEWMRIKAKCSNCKEEQERLIKASDYKKYKYEERKD